MRIIGFGHGLFAVAGLGLAVLSLVYQDFALIWQPLPSWVPWPERWSYASGVVLSIASAGLCLARTAPASALTIGAYLAVWAVTRAEPVLLEPFSVASWYGFCEAMAPVLGAWLLYARLQGQSGVSPAPFVTSKRAMHAAQVLFGLACLGYGLAHFAYADLTASMVPAWLPDRLGFAYVAGLCHIAAGIGIVVGVLARLAAVLEASMMSLFGLLVWLPTLLTEPPPEWAKPPQYQWSEIVITLLLAASAWIVAASLRNRPWGFAWRSQAAASK